MHLVKLLKHLDLCILLHEIICERKREKGWKGGREGGKAERREGGREKRMIRQYEI